MPAKTALGHLRVLDLTRYRAGPFCTKLLADYGAEVIKVEQPGVGDPARRLGSFPDDSVGSSVSGLYLQLNGGKRSVTLDLKCQTGQDLLEQLVQQADIVVENFSPVTREGLGLDYDRFDRLKPGIIFTSISNFGQTGPYRDWKATDLVEYALGGLMYLIGLNSREPLRHGVNQAEYLAGSLAATATLTAVAGRRLHGFGDHLDVSIQEAVASGLQASLQYYGFMGASRWRRSRETTALIDIFPTKDGYVVPGTGGFGDWETYVACLDIPELLDDRFATHDARQRNNNALVELLIDKLSTMGHHEVFHRGQEWGFPFGIVQSPEDLVNCQQLESRNWWQSVDRGDGTPIKVPGPMFRLNATPAPAGRPARALGADNADVYGAFGLTDADLIRLRDRGVI